MSNLHAYTMALDAATLRQRSGAGRWPQDRLAAYVVLLLAAHWTMQGELSPNLLREAAESMPESDAVALAQTLGGIAMRGAGMARETEVTR